HHVAVEKDGAADTDRVAIHAGEDRLRKGRKRAEHAGDRLDQRWMLRGVEEFGEIATQAEAAGKPAQQYDPYLVVLRRVPKRRRQPIVGPAVEQRSAVVRSDGGRQYMMA